MSDSQRGGIFVVNVGKPTALRVTRESSLVFAVYYSLVHVAPILLGVHACQVWYKEPTKKKAKEI
jgi:hypothetical protein